MAQEKATQPNVKEKVIREAHELFWIFLFLALFFCTLATYSMLLLDEYHVKYLTYGSALLQALVLSKVLLIGEKAHLGKRHEDKPLIVSAVYKAFLFALLAAIIHVIEELVKQKLHGSHFSLRELRLDQVLVRNLVVFWAFIPFFMFAELYRVLGDTKFKALLLNKRGEGEIAEEGEKISELPRS